MRRRTLIAISVAAAFTLPLTVQAAGDKAKSADTGATPSASQGASSSGFQALDKNRDGKLTPEEIAAAPAQANEKAGAGGTSGKPKY